MISIILPIFNEEENLPLLYDRLSKVVKTVNMPYEIIFINDGSADKSEQLIRDILAHDKNVVLINFSRNFGHQAAISAGLKYAKGKVAAILDADLQDPPEELPRLIAKWKEGFQVVYAIRTKRKEGIFKRAAYAIFYRTLQMISDIDIPLDSGDFCLMDRKVVDALNIDMPERIRFVRGLRAFAGFKQVGIESERSERHAGKPKYTFRKLMKLAMDGIFDFSTFPLRLSSYLGFFIAFTSFLIGIFFILSRIFDFKILEHSPVENPGLATTVVGIFFLGGIILIILGIMGEYLGRIYYEVKQRPFYIVSEVCQHQNKSV